ncbi:hypothetical protein ACFQ1I_04005 [Kitasatospora arboriphila]
MLHETLSMPVGSPDGLYELGAYAYMDGPCGMVRGTTMGSVSYEFTGGTPAREPSRATGGGATDTPSPRVSTSRTPGAAGTPGSPSPAPSGSPSPSAPSSPSVSAPPSPGGSPMSSPSPTPPVAASPAVVPLATTPAANGSSALPWVIGLLAALAAVAVGGVLALRRRPR